MKKLSLLLVLCAALLSSCGGNTDTTGDNASGSQTVVGQENDQVSAVNPRFSEYAEFPQCMEIAQQSCNGDVECIQKGTDQCMMEAAAFTGDRSALKCEEFTSLLNKNACVLNETMSQARQAGNTEICTTLNAGDAEICQKQVTLQIAMQTGDLSVCDAGSAAEKLSCSNSILMNQALREMDVKICEKIGAGEFEQENFEKTMCIEQIEMMQENLLPDAQ